MLNNFNDYSQKRIWKGKKNPLIDIKDEDYLFKVPDNCRIKNSNKINIIQSVIRTEYDSGFVSYFYDINHFSELKNDAATPLQFSFLIIHEWLWDFFPSNKVNQLRELNYLLHSPQLDELSTADLTVIFSNLDFPKDPIMQKPNPNALNKEYLELGENMACYGKNNHLHCWGREFSKEAVRALNNVQIENISGLAIGFHHGCLIDQGKIACYGTSGYNATWGSQSQEIMQNIREPLSLYSSKDLDCALTKLDGLQCYHEERPIPFLSEPYDLVTTNEYSCAFTKHGIKCFGMIANSIKKEIEAIDLMKVVDIAGNSTNICILFSKKIECFGSSIPLKEDTPQIFNPSEIAVGKNHACVIDDGQIKCWGDNRRYQLEVPTINNPQYIRAAGDYSCTRDSVGIRCWGGGDDRALTQCHKIYTRYKLTSSINF
ncbi:MAG: RCC1 domain-containing protein [Bdellovibrionota bacterium]